MSHLRSPCDARSDASLSTAHPLMYRNLPPWYIMAPSINRPTRASPGRSKPPLVPVSGTESRPHLMAWYVLGWRTLHKVHRAPIFDDGPIVCACLVQGHPATLDLTHLPSHHAQNLAAVVNPGYIYTSTDAGVTWTEQTNASSSSWQAIASSSNGIVRVWMQAITQYAPPPCLRWWPHRVCMYRAWSLWDARPDASSSTTHPVIHRTLPPWSIRATSIPPPTRASPGRSKPSLVSVTITRSRPRRMAWYVCECGPSQRRINHAHGGPIVCACLVERRPAMLDLTYPGRLPILSCTEPCRCGVWGPTRDVDRRGRRLDAAIRRWGP